MRARALTAWAATAWVCFDRVGGDRMGMLATVINSLGLAMAIRSAGVDAEVFTSTPMKPIAEYYTRDNAVAAMERGAVALIAGGTGNPFFTTDSAAALRACEIGAGALLKGTRVDGVYTADPEKDPTATRYDELTFDKALSDGRRSWTAPHLPCARTTTCPSWSST